MDTPACILAVEDQLEILEWIEQSLESAGYRVLTALDGIEAVARLESDHVDLIVADISMPRMNGYQLYDKVTSHREWTVIPFIFLTGRSLESDIRYGRELGADDYVTKPFKAQDLLASVRGRLRRAQQLAGAQSNQRSDVLSVGRLNIDLAQHRVVLDGNQIRLSAREFNLLACLARQHNRVVRLQELVQETHALDVNRSRAGALLRPLVRSLRRKFGYQVGQRGCIESIRGVGYRLLSFEDWDRQEGIE